MKFEIDFNRTPNDEILNQLGAKLLPTGSTKYPPFEFYQIELNTFEELEELLKKVDLITNKMYCAIISFDPPIIFLDDDV